MSASQSDVVNAMNAEFCFRFIPFCKLHRSKKNMRTVNPVGDGNDAELHRSIGAKGLLQNLVVYQREDGDYEVPAGGRRFGSLELHEKEGNLSTNALIPCQVVPEVDATNVSLMENYQRKAPHPADTYSAFLALTKQGLTCAEIARQHGITELDVARYMRLGQLNTTLMKLFKANKLSLDQVLVFASTPDTKRQLAVFKALGEDTDASANLIRRELLNNRHSSDTALAQFVTLDAYLAAGGASEHDLFSETYMLCDIDLLTRLAQEKLDAAADKITGWGWIETSTGGAHSLYDYSRLPAVQLNVPKSKSDKLAAMKAELDTLESMADSDWESGGSEKYDALESGIEKLEEELDDHYTGFNEGDMAYGGCLVTIDHNDGALQVYKGLLKKEDVKRFQNKDKDTSNESKKPKTVSVTKASNDDLSAKLAADLGLVRRAAIRAALLNKPQAAMALMHFNLCLSVLGDGLHRYDRVLDINFNTQPDETSIEDYKTSKAAKVITTAHAKLDIGWLSAKTQVKQFAAFRSLSTAKRNALVCYCTSMLLGDGNELPGKNPLIDSLTDEIELDLSRYWRPNAENYFSRLSKAYLLALGKSWYGAAWAKAHANDSKKGIVAIFDQLFNGSAKQLNEKEREIRANWLPPQL